MNISWVSQASLDITRDLNLMDLMARSGCLGHVIGFESITADSIKECKKSPNISKLSSYAEPIKILREYGLQTWAAFTLGYDHDTYDSILATEKFARNNKFTFAAFNILTPYPNTGFYNKLQQQSRLLFDGKWWLHPEYHFNQASFIPHNMDPEQLTEACHKARKKFNSLSSLLYRFSDIKTNIRSIMRATTYWRYTLLYRKEMYKKHLMKFGSK